jgi:cytochrome c553
MKMMKAAVVHAFRRPSVIEEVPIPESGPGEILVRIAASGVCHTDLRAADGDWPVKPKLPFIPEVDRWLCRDHALTHKSEGTTSMTKNMHFAAAAAFAAAMSVGVTHAQAGSDSPMSGKATSQMLCSRCHDTTGSKFTGRTLDDGSAPPFALIAQDPKMTPKALRTFLRLPHGKMAVLTLTQAEVDGLIAYIDSFDAAAAKPAGAN